MLTKVIFDRIEFNHAYARMIQIRESSFFSLFLENLKNY